MNTDKLEKVRYTNITQPIMAIIRKYGSDNPELEKDLFQLIEIVEKEERKSDDIRELVYVLANKL